MVAGPTGVRVVGWDAGAALALAGAMGIPPAASAEFLPLIEAAMQRKMNEVADHG